MSIGSGIRWNGLSAVAGQGSHFLRLVLVAAATGPSTAGKYAIAAAIVGGASMMTEVGFRQQFIATPLKASGEAVEYKLSVAWKLSILQRLTVIGLSLSLFVINSLSNVLSTETIYAAIFLCVSSAVSALVNPELLRRERLGDFKPNALCESLGQALSLLLVVACLSRFASLTLLIGSHLAASTIHVIASYALFDRRKLHSIRVRDLAHMARQGRPFTIIAATTFATYGLDKLVLGFIGSTQAVGIYYIAQRLAEIPVSAFAVVIGRTAMPAYLKQAHKGPSKIILSVRSYTHALFVILAPCYLAVLVALYFFPTVFPSAWSQAEDTLAILLIAASFRLGCHLLAPAMVVCNQVAMDARYKVQEAIAYLPLLVFFVWKWQEIGAAAATVLIYFFSWLRRYRFMSQIQQPNG